MLSSERHRADEVCQCNKLALWRHLLADAEAARACDGFLPDRRSGRRFAFGGLRDGRGSEDLAKDCSCEAVRNTRRMMVGDSAFLCLQTIRIDNRI